MWWYHRSSSPTGLLPKKERKRELKERKDRKRKKESRIGDGKREKKRKIMNKRAET